MSPYPGSRSAPARRLSPKQAAQVKELTQAFLRLLKEKRYEEALDCCRRAAKLAPGMSGCHSDAALCLTYLGRWEEAIAQCKLALRYGPPALPTLDLLSQSYGYLGQMEMARNWGLKALNARLKLFDRPVAMPHAPAPLPPPPSPATREHNIIAFSLFGASPKYCETAIFNAEARARVYPDWTCHFYVDETVPEHVLARLDIAGSRVMRVPDHAKPWPGPMWRFLAYDTLGVHRVVFRDADSLISTREANAVAAWIASGRLFHHMRDFQTHTELLLAGLWGCGGGSLPPMRLLVETFMREPLKSEHFADQFFLREFVWPYARSSLLQHDSLFGFLEAAPFPDGPPPPDFHVGVCESGGIVTLAIDVPDSTPVEWTLERFRF